MHARRSEPNRSRREVLVGHKVRREYIHGLPMRPGRACLSALVLVVPVHYCWPLTRRAVATSNPRPRSVSLPVKSRQSYQSARLTGPHLARPSNLSSDQGGRTAAQKVALQTRTRTLRLPPFPPGRAARLGITAPWQIQLLCWDVLVCVAAVCDLLCLRTYGTSTRSASFHFAVDRGRPPSPHEVSQSGSHVPCASGYNGPRASTQRLAPPGARIVQSVIRTSTWAMQ